MKVETQETVFRLRWVVLMIMGFVIIGCYYAYDSVVPIADSIIKDMGITRAQYGLLFSYYSVPNLIMVLIGGIFLDKVGIRKAGTLFAGLCVLGILLTALGSTFRLMLWGRLIYGIGAESLLVAEQMILAKWFRGKELAFAMGLNITVIRLGNLGSLNLGATIQKWSGTWRTALWVAVALILVSFILYLVYSRLDKSKEPFFKSSGGAGKIEKFKVRDIFAFRTSYWLIALLCVTFYSAVLPFIAFSNIFLQKKFGMTAAQGGFYISLVFVATMICTPLFGLLVDKIGKRSTILILGSLLLIPVYLILGLTSLHPAFPIFFLGISFSIVPAVLWSCVPIMVGEKRLGTAYGLIVLIQNIGLTVFPWLAGKITDLSGGEYRNTMLLFSSLGLFGLIFSLSLRFSERKGKGMGLELPTKLAQAKNFD